MLICHCMFTNDLQIILMNWKSKLIIVFQKDRIIFINNLYKYRGKYSSIGIIYINT